MKEDKWKGKHIPWKASIVFLLAVFAYQVLYVFMHIDPYIYELFGWRFQLELLLSGVNFFLVRLGGALILEAILLFLIVRFLFKAKELYLYDLFSALFASYTGVVGFFFLQDMLTVGGQEWMLNHIGLSFALFLVCKLVPFGFVYLRGAEKVEEVKRHVLITSMLLPMFFVLVLYFADSFFL